MSQFIYWSFIIVGIILLIKNGWEILKFAFKAWYYFFAVIIVGVIFFVVVLPLLLKFIFH